MTTQGYDPTITLTADDVRCLDVAALRARGPAAIRAVVDGGESEPAATEAVERNIDTFITHLQAHPDTGALVTRRQHPSILRWRAGGPQRQRAGARCQAVRERGADVRSDV